MPSTPCMSGICALQLHISCPMGHPISTRRPPRAPIKALSSRTADSPLPGRPSDPFLVVRGCSKPPTMASQASPMGEEGGGHSSSAACCAREARGVKSGASGSRGSADTVNSLQRAYEHFDTSRCRTAAVARAPLGRSIPSGSALSKSMDWVGVASQLVSQLVKKPGILERPLQGQHAQR